MLGSIAWIKFQVFRQGIGPRFIFLLRQQSVGETQARGRGIATRRNRLAELFFGARCVVRAKESAAQREMALVILGRNPERCAILLDGLVELSGMFQRKSGQISRAAFGGLQVSRAAKCLRGSSWIGIH